MQDVPTGTAVRVAGRLINFPQRGGRAPQTIRALLSDWRTARMADGRRVRGVSSYVAKVEQFLNWSGEIAPGDLTEELIARYKIALYERELASGTIRHHLTVLRSLSDWCVKKGLIARNMALEVDHPKVEDPDPDPLTRAEIDALLLAIDEPARSHRSTWRRNRRAIMLGLYGGLRIAEIAELKWRDVDLARGEIIIRKKGGKGGKARVVPVCDELDAELRLATPHKDTDAVVDQGNGKPLSVKSLSHIHERWLRRRGIVLHSHQLRKTFATELYIAGEDLATIQRLLGHSDPKTTLRYIGASAPKERAAVQKLKFRS